MAARLNIKDSVAVWIEKINAVLDLQNVDGAFVNNDTRWENTTFTLSGGKVRSGTRILNVPGSSLILPTASEVVVGVDVLGTSLTYHPSDSLPATDFIPLYVIQTNNERIVSVDDVRTWAYEDSGAAADAVAEHEDKTDPHPQYSTDTKVDGIDSRLTDRENELDDAQFGLDRRVIYVDTIADLQALVTSGLVDGQLASVRASKFRWNSADAAWKAVSFLDVRAFGAVGDGVADDTAAIIAAMDFLTEGGRIYFGRGDFRITSNLSLAPKVAFFGEGSSEADAGSTSLFPTRIIKDFAGTGITLLGHHSSIVDITLAGASGNTGDGIHLYGNNTKAERVLVYGMGGTGVKVGDSVTDRNTNAWVLTDVLSRFNGGDGFYIDSLDPGYGPDANAGLGSMIRAQGNTGDGCRINNAQVNTFVQGYMESNGGAGWRLQSGAQRNTFLNCGSEQNTGGNGVFESGSVVNMFFGTMNWTPTDSGTNQFIRSTGVANPSFELYGTRVLRLNAGMSGGPSNDYDAGIPVAGSTPGFSLYETDGPVDEKHWSWLAAAGVLRARVKSDDGSSFSDVFTATRSGTSLSSVSLSTTVLGVNGRVETHRVRPTEDNVHSLGDASFRWSQVYSGSGTINTSDEREKQDIDYLDDAELRVANRLKGLVKKFRFKNAVEEKGEDARIHVGVIAQEVKDAFAAEGLDAMRYGIVCYDEWDEKPEVVESWEDEYDSDGELIRSAGSEVVQQFRPAGDRYGVRYDELLAFIISAM